MAQISAAEAHAQVGNESVLFLDVRRPDELEAIGKVSAKKYLNIIHTNVSAEFGKADNDFKVAYAMDKPGVEDEIIVYCKAGGRSAMAQNALIDLGYKNVSNWVGGYNPA